MDNLDRAALELIQAGQVAQVRLRTIRRLIDDGLVVPLPEEGYPLTPAGRAELRMAHGMAAQQVDEQEWD